MSETQLLAWACAPALLITASLIFFIISAIRNISLGRNWARIIALLMGIINVIISIFCIFLYAHFGHFITLILPALTIIHMVALFFLFTGQGASWFKEIKNYKKEQLELIAIQMPAKPKSFAIAIWLLWINLFISFTYFLLMKDEILNITTERFAKLDVPQTWVHYFFWGTLMVYLICVWLNYKITVGRQWARILLLIFCLYGLFGFLISLNDPLVMRFYNPSTLKGCVSILIWILTYSALGLLFTKSSNSWYRKQKELMSQANS
jgi:hypothetical protein